MLIAYKATGPKKKYRTYCKHSRHFSVTVVNIQRTRTASASSQLFPGGYTLLKLRGGGGGGGGGEGAG